MTMHVPTNLCIHHHCIGVLDGAQVNFFGLISFTNRSESPSQVFLILLQWLLSLVKALGGPSNLPAITVAYDNICNVEKMRITRKPLPLPPPYNKLWMNVQKIIDVFHFPNHISATCWEQFSPLQFKETL